MSFDSSIFRSSQAISRFTTFSCADSDSSLCSGTLYHLYMQPRQQQAVAYDPREGTPEPTDDGDGVVIYLPVKQQEEDCEWCDDDQQIGG